MSSEFKQRIAYIGAIVALVPSTWIEFDQGNITIAVILFLIIVLNVSALRLRGTSSAILNIILHVLNAAAVFLIAVQFLESGKPYLHIPYFMACSGFLIAAVIYYMRLRKTKIHAESGQKRIQNDPSTKNV